MLPLSWLLMQAHSDMSLCIKHFPSPPFMLIPWQNFSMKWHTSTLYQSSNNILACGNIQILMTFQKTPGACAYLRGETVVQDRCHNKEGILPRVCQITLLHQWNPEHAYIAISSEIGQKILGRGGPTRNLGLHYLNCTWKSNGSQCSSCRSSITWTIHKALNLPLHSTPAKDSKCSSRTALLCRLHCNTLIEKWLRHEWLRNASQFKHKWKWCTRCNCVKAFCYLLLKQKL